VFLCKLGQTLLDGTQDEGNILNYRIKTRFIKTNRFKVAIEHARSRREML
jgi:hypothetical protein